MTRAQTRPVSIARFNEAPPTVDTSDVRSWVARGTNFVVVVSEVKQGARIERTAQPDEYMVFLVDAGAVFEAGGETMRAGPETLMIVPPGASSFSATGDGRVVTFYSVLASDVLEMAVNASDFTERASEVAPLVHWPEPADGLRLRAYPVGDYTRPDSNMRIFRSTNLMVNVMLPRPVPRDVSKLSPHAHADFEQGSLALQGDWVHHVRYPWGADMTTWRDDEHASVGSPSLAVIPPKAVHTSRNLNEGGSWLFDIFAPPRLDFSSKPGMVANERDYPLPPDI